MIYFFKRLLRPLNRDDSIRRVTSSFDTGYYESSLIEKIFKYIYVFESSQRLWQYFLAYHKLFVKMHIKEGEGVKGNKIKLNFTSFLFRLSLSFYKLHPFENFKNIILKILFFTNKTTKNTLTFPEKNFHSTNIYLLVFIPKLIFNKIIG